MSRWARHCRAPRPARKRQGGCACASQDAGCLVASSLDPPSRKEAPHCRSPVPQRGLVGGPAGSPPAVPLQASGLERRPRLGLAPSRPGSPAASMSPDAAPSRGWGLGRGLQTRQGRATPTASESIITWWSFFAAKLGPSKSWASQEASGLTSPHLSQMRSQTTEKTLHFAGEQKTKHTRLHSSQH